MDQLICASLSHIHYWYEVDMLKVSAIAYVRVHQRLYKLLGINSQRHVKNDIWPQRNKPGTIYSVPVLTTHSSDINRVATKVRTYFEMRTDGQRFFV